MLKTIYSLCLAFLLLQPAGATEGDVIWQHATGAPIRGGVLLDSAGGIIFGNLAGQVFSLDAQQKSRWQRDIPGEISTTPLRFEQVILISSHQGLFALNERSGEILWQKSLAPRNTSKIWDALHPDPVLIGANVLFALGNQLMLLDAATGRVHWQKALNSAITATPTVQQKIAFLATEYGELLKIKLSNGQVLWTSKAAQDMIQSQPILDGDALIFASRDGKIRAWSISNKKTRWEVDHGGEWVMATGLLDKQRIIIGSSDSFLLQSIDSQTGKIEWELPAKQNVFHRAAISADRYWFATGDTYALHKPGQLISVSRDGTDSKTFTLPAAAYGQLVSTTERIWVGAENGSLYLIATQ